MMRNSNNRAPSPPPKPQALQVFFCPSPRPPPPVLAVNRGEYRKPILQRPMRPGGILDRCRYMLFNPKPFLPKTRRGE